MSALALLLMAWIGCKHEAVDTGQADVDGDGYTLQDDCDDGNAEINPAAVEVCDGVDNNCDGDIDESGLNGEPVFADQDGDGYGDPGVSQLACGPSSGWVENDLDCDDADAGVSPAADESCDGVDNDCDGEIDELGAVDETDWTFDGDADGYGDDSLSISSCTAPPNYVADGGDCDDSNPFANPGREELCATSYDDDCDGSVNEPQSTDAIEWYPDLDGDGYGLSSTPVLSCLAPASASDNALDCDDSDPQVNPDGVEVCDGVDNDCDGSSDGSDAVDANSWHVDRDSDGYGDPSSLVSSCSSTLSGYVLDEQDCDDSDAAINPSATEVCDTYDNDCDGSVDNDDAADASTWYLDSDGDGYGDSSSSHLSCSAPTGYVSDATDCDDGEATTNPGATEYCDGVDNDCDTEYDEDDAADATTWYIDNDGDGDGDSSASLTQCSQPSGYVENDSDCDDSDSTLHTGTIWYYDYDQDDYGVSTSTVTQCADPGAYYSLSAGDCRPYDAEDYPGADEYCDSVDNDCDGDTDEADAVDVSIWYADADADGYGDPSVTETSCSASSGYVADSSDCDDSDASVTTTQTWYIDSDGDGEGDSTTSLSQCEQPSGYVADSSDCDDSDAALNSATVWYYDYDLDGYGVSSSSLTTCTKPSSRYSLVAGDCAAYDSDTYPGATEICVSGTSAEGTDNDCDGDIDEECAEIHCGTISADETWAVNTYGHQVTCAVYVQGSASPQLTVDPGVEVEFDANTGIYVGYSNNGALAVEGVGGNRVTFTSSSASPSAGDWVGVYIGGWDTGSVLEYLSVEYAGSSTSFKGGVSVSAADPELNKVFVDDCDQNGLYVTGASSVLVQNSKFGRWGGDAVTIGISGGVGAAIRGQFCRIRAQCAQVREARLWRNTGRTGDRTTRDIDAALAHSPPAPCREHQLRRASR